MISPNDIFEKGVEASNLIIKNIQEIAHLIFPDNEKKNLSLQGKLIVLVIKENQKELKKNQATRLGKK